MRNTMERQLQKRVFAVEAIMRSREWRYVVASEWLRPAHLPFPAECLPPDPTDTSTSKRAWEKAVIQWRLSLKSLQAREQ